MTIVRDVERVSWLVWGGSLAKKLWGLVRGPGEAELRGLETWRRRPWRRRTQIYFRVSSQGNWRGKCSLNPGKERQGGAGLAAGGEEESTAFCLLIPPSVSPLQHLPQALELMQLKGWELGSSRQERIQLLTMLPHLSDRPEPQQDQPGGSELSPGDPRTMLRVCEYPQLSCQARALSWASPTALPLDLG